MTTARPARSRIAEWLRRYLPCEIAGTAGEFGAAALAYASTDSLAAAAVAATVGASAGYYATAFATALRWSYRALAGRPPAARLAIAHLLALRSVAVEFGPAELVDSIAVRPLAFYVGPALFGNVAAGWIFGKLVSDVAFYACAIVSYERFGALLARRPRPDTPAEEQEPDHDRPVRVA
jgi:hypothetical protein